MIDKPYELFTDTVKRYESGQSIDLEKVRQCLIELDQMYAEGKVTPLSDEEYDKFHQIYIAMTGEIIRGDSGSLIKAKHDYPELKGTVKKTHYITEKQKEEDPGSSETHRVLYNWYLRTYKKLNPNKNHYLGFWPKYDGCSLILSLDKDRKITKAITRGDEEFGVDRSSIFNGMEMQGIIPHQYDGEPVGLKCECIMPKSLFPKFREKYADQNNRTLVNERTAVSALFHTETFTDIHRKFLHLRPLMFATKDHELKSFTSDDGSFGPFSMIPYGDQPVSPKALGREISELKKFIDEKMDYQCDGVIIRWYDEDAMKTLGRDTRNYINYFEVAYKFPKANNYTTIKDLRQDIGVMGNVSYVADINPIVINDKTIRHVSLGSHDRAEALHLAPGDMVNIKYEIIPYLCIDSYCEQHRSGNKPFELIDKCPYCGEDLVYNPQLMCPNTDCPSRIQGKILNFCIRLNIKGIGPAVIENLFQQGMIHGIQDLFGLSEREDEYCQSSGCGKKIFRKVTKQFKNLKATEAELLGAIGIRGFGPKKAKDISNIYYIQDILEMSKDIPKGVKNMMCNGFREATSKKILEGIRDNYELIKFLLDHMEVKHKKEKKASNVVVFTGFRNPAFKEHLEKMNIRVDDAVTKKTSLVIASDPNARSGKLEKARKLNIPILSMVEAYTEYGYNK